MNTAPVKILDWGCIYLESLRSHNVDRAFGKLDAAQFSETSTAHESVRGRKRKFAA